MNEGWIQELEHPSGAFFEALAARVRLVEGGAEDGADGAVQAAREAVELLVPRVDWAAYLPQAPHGLLGLWAVFRLRPLLSGRSFLRLLATQLHALAHEARAPRSRWMPTFAQGSGHWGNLSMAIETRRPSIAWGEAVGSPHPAKADFHRLGALVSGDMACVGQKAVMARCLGELHGMLGGEPAAGRRLLGICAWIAAGPEDTYWNRRIQRRLGSHALRACDGLDEGGRGELARIVCEGGLVELLDRFAAATKSGVGAGDLRAILARAASWKQLDAHRELEGKTSWNFLYLACVDAMAGGPAEAAAPWNHAEPWIQAAALIHLFPTGDEASRPSPKAPAPGGDPAQVLVEAILDGEVPQAMHWARELRDRGEGQALLRALAEAASQNDPAFNHGSHILAVAAAAELAARIPDGGGELLPALAKMLANTQGPGDLGRRAELHFR